MTNSRCLRARLRGLASSTACMLQSYQPRRSSSPNLVLMGVWDDLGWTDPDRRDAAIDRLVDDLSAKKETLSEVERRTVLYLSYGLGERGAAEMLGVSYETARTHTQHARRKLCAKNIAHLVALALRQKLIE